MGGSGYGPSRNAMATLYGAVRGAAEFRDRLAVDGTHFTTVLQWEPSAIYMSRYP